MADQPIPPGREWTGTHKVAKDSRWLCAEDLPVDRDVPVEIEKVIRRDGLTMQEGRPIKVALSLKFKGKQKELILNRTNAKTLAVLFDSNDCGAWFGKRIALFVKTGVRYPDGTKGPAIRIRAKRMDQTKTGSDVVFDKLAANPLPDDAEQRETMLLAIDQEAMNRDMDQSAVMEMSEATFSGWDEFVKLPLADLSKVLEALSKLG